MRRLPPPAFQEARGSRFPRWGAVHLLWKFLGRRDDGKKHSRLGNPYGFAFAVQPPIQPVVMFGAGAGTASPIVGDGAAGLAVPRLIERDHATLGGRRNDLPPHQSIPLAGL